LALVYEVRKEPDLGNNLSFVWQNKLNYTLFLTMLNRPFVRAKAL
jgi:hypothetical protein